MGVFIATMKTHSTEDLSTKYMFIQDCIVHGCKPKVLDIVAGKRKEHHFVVKCKEESCGKISMISADHVVTVWNHYNPTSLTPKSKDA